MFKEAGTSSDEFYANAFVLHSQGLQQTETGGIFQGILRPKITDPGPQLVKDLIQGVGSKVDKKRLGRNLLDSFALILARPGGKGVVAVVIEKLRDQNTYQLHVSMNNTPNEACKRLAEKIQEWFSNRGQDTVESGHPRSQSILWDDILRNCCQNISTSIANACIGDTEEEKHELLQGTLLYVRDLNITLNKRGEEAKKVEKFLDLLSTFFSTPTSNNSNISNLGTSKGASIYSERGKCAHGNGRMLRFLHGITEECFGLVESHAVAMRKYFNDLNKKLQEALEDVEIYRRLLGRVRSLIYTIAKYLRAWYDIVHFKAHCNSADLVFKFVMRKGRRPGGRGLDFDKILSQAAQLGIFDAKNKKSMRALHGVRQNCISAWNHCEMQMLEFVLANQESIFYNYIGCSKGPCWLCYHVLVNMTSQFEMRPSHFKLYPRWLPPHFTKNQAHKEQFVAVLKLLTKEMRRLIDLRKGGEYQPQNARSDCPDDEDTFLSLREAPKS
ncbi:hypothetical protein Daesc_002967 [Daldinia eschscholtzii]|uniref:Uncharacterized protein n=1 Tax=Daldinia eschscholtzii TaxID=292717 RepID=A0AAX6MS61_9PEZI